MAYSHAHTLSVFAVLACLVQKEKQQSLAYLLAQVQKLPLQPLNNNRNSSCSDDDSLVQDSSLPPWTSVGVQLLWSAFDADQDGDLTDAEWAQLNVRTRIRLLIADRMRRVCI